MITITNLKYIYLIAIAFSIYLFTSYFKPLTKDYTFPFVATSYTFDQLKPYLQERVDFIKNESGYLNPYNEDKFEMFSNVFLNATDIQQLALSSTMLPNADVGNISLQPLKDCPVDITTLQFGVGSLDWYWLYGTFLNPKPCNFFFYMVKVEIIPEILRRRLNLPIGAGSMYNIAGGVGIDGNWIYSPYMTTRGQYAANTETSFSFQALDLPNGWSCAMKSDGLGSFNINFTWPDKSGKIVGINNTDMMSVRPPFYNGENGCAPCSGGAGTLYMSYTNMNCENTSISNGLEDIVLNNGKGWIDRQYINTNIQDKNTQILYNITSTFKNMPKGLGKYLWLNLNLAEDLQYMISCFPDEIEVGKEIKTISVNEYGDKPSYNISDCKVFITDLITVDKVVYPRRFEIHIRDNVYYLDSTLFGPDVTLDFTNNFHWSGSAPVSDKSGKIIGLGFIEANKVQDNDLYSKNLLDFLNIPSTSKNIDISNNNKFSFSQTYQSFFLFIVYTVIFVYLSYKLIVDLYEFLKSSGKVTFDLRKIGSIFFYVIAIYVIYVILEKLISTKNRPRVKNANN